MSRHIAMFLEEVQKLDHWADGLRFGPERDLKEIDREIADARRAANLAQTLQEKLDAQRAVKALEKKRSNKRREIFEAQDAIDGQRNELIGKLEGQLKQRVGDTPLFLMRWKFPYEGVVSPPSRTFRQ